MCQFGSGYSNTPYCKWIRTNKNNVKETFVVDETLIQIDGQDYYYYYYYYYYYWLWITILQI